MGRFAIGRTGRSRPARRLHQAVRSVAMFAAVAVLFANVALSSKRSGHASTPRGSLLPRRALLQDDGESLYPSDAFSQSELKAGAIMLHVIGVLYTFTAIAIVCDDFFVPALEVLVERYDIEDDVAGATFMAAGGSAPELFTALIGVFIAKSNVGFGTIIGSAVFNVLFVIGACAFFSKEILVLTWWPLARDCTFYTFDLVMLYVFFRDQKIELYESILLLVFYGCYVGFMKFNVRAEVWFKSRVLGQKGFDAEARAAAKADALASQGQGGNGADSKGVRSGGSVKSLAKTLKSESKNGSAEGSRAATPPQGSGTRAPQTLTPRGETVPGSPEALANAASKAEKDGGDGDDEDDDEGIDLSWPKDTFGRIYFVWACPIMYLLAYTIPNCKKRNDLWPLVFVQAILYIGFFSYFMVWWATTIGAIAGISDEVMGYTFLAAGTSVPDLMSSVLVAREGKGDMAVSSSIGSNIFDITFGLPLPWMLWSLFNGFEYFPVNSDSLTFSLVLLIIMLVSIVAIIAQQGWKMTNTLGAAMVFLYALFLALVLLNSGGHIAGF